MENQIKILVLLAHPALQNSRGNASLLNAIKSMDSVTVHDLYECYPEYQIDVKAEQKKLRENDLIVFQHPFYWYSFPSLLKEWMDLVLEYGFAFGPGGIQLKGKGLLVAVTTGGSEQVYAGNKKRYTVPQLLAPVEQTARFCGMEWFPPFVVFGAPSATDETLVQKSNQYRKLLQGLSSKKFSLETFQNVSLINHYLASGEINDK